MQNIVLDLGLEGHSFLSDLLPLCGTEEHFSAHPSLSSTAKVDAKTSFLLITRITIMAFS